MKLVVVTSKAPFGNGEPYLLPEIRELTRHFESITLLPVHRPKAGSQVLPPGVTALAWGYCDGSMLRMAARAFVAAPLRATSIVTRVLFSRDPGKARNVAVLVKGLALAQWAIEQRIDHIHAYWLSTPATVAMIAAFVARIPWSSTAHRQDIYKRNALDVKARSVSFVRTISRRGTRDLIAREEKLGGCVVHLPLGTDVPAGPPVARLRRQSQFRIICAAGLAQRKGQMELLEALALLRDRAVPAYCTFAGEGSFRAALERRAKDLRVEAMVTFAGFVPQAKLLQQYEGNAFDVLAMCSQADEGDVPAEGVPAALIEAMAHGVPVVTTPSGGIPDLVDEGCGWIVPANDAEALADALYQVYLQPAVARARALEAFERVGALHDARRQMRLLSRYIAGAGGQRAPASSSLHESVCT